MVATFMNKLCDLADKLNDGNHTIELKAIRKCLTMGNLIFHEFEENKTEIHNFKPENELENALLKIDDIIIYKWKDEIVYCLDGKYHYSAIDLVEYLIDLRAAKKEQIELDLRKEIAQQLETIVLKQPINVSRVKVRRGRPEES